MISALSHAADGAAFYVYEKSVRMSYWVKWGYSDKECRGLPISHYPDATDSDSDQERLQEAFERYGTTRQIPFS